MHKEQEEFKSFIESAVTASNELPVIPRKQLLPLTSLDWKLFEQLCCKSEIDMPNASNNDARLSCDSSSIRAGLEI